MNTDFVSERDRINALDQDVQFVFLQVLLHDRDERCNVKTSFARVPVLVEVLLTMAYMRISVRTACATSVPHVDMYMVRHVHSLHMLYTCIYACRPPVHVCSSHSIFLEVRLQTVMAAHVIAVL